MAGEIVRAMFKRWIHVEGARVPDRALKNSCPGLRNTLMVDLAEELRDHGVQVDVYAPWAFSDEARGKYGLELIASPRATAYYGIILAITHDAFRAASAGALRSYGRDGGGISNMKCVLACENCDQRL